MKSGFWHSIVLGAALLVSACGRPGAEDLPLAVLQDDWAQVPEGVEWGQVTAVDVDSHGHVFVLQRGSREWVEPFPSEPIAQDTIFMFASNGRLLGSFGGDALVMPHGLSVDTEDNVWVTDAGREQVIRFGHDGGEQVALGERGVSGVGGLFGRPTDIAFDGDRVLVSDGYTNARVAVFDRLGDYVEEYGEAGDGEGQFNLPHALALDDDFLYVADRENRRVQVLDKRTGEPRGMRGQAKTGHPYAVAAIGGGWLAVAEGRDVNSRSGAVIRLYRPDGQLEKAFDAGLEDGSSRAHDMAIGRDGALYLADVTGGRIVKIDLARSGEAEEIETE